MLGIIIMALAEAKRKQLNADNISLSPFFLSWWWRLAINSYILNCLKKIILYFIDSITKRSHPTMLKQCHEDEQHYGNGEVAEQG